MGIGTFYLQFPDKSDLMRFLMEEEHQYRVRAFDAMSTDSLPAELTRVLTGSDPALMRAMIEACGIDERLRDFGRTLRKETEERLAAALARARDAREIRRPALHSGTAAWAALVMSDRVLTPAVAPAFEKVVTVLAFTEDDGEIRIRV